MRNEFAIEQSNNNLFDWIKSGICDILFLPHKVEAVFDLNNLPKSSLGLLFVYFLPQT